MPGIPLINILQNFTGALRQQLFRQLNAHLLRLRCGAATFATYHLAAVRGADQCTQPQAVAIQFGIAADRYLATAFQSGIHRPFGANTSFGYGVIEWSQQRAGGFIVKAAFNAHCTLTDGRQALFRAQRATDALFQAQAFEPGDRQNNGVVVAVVQF